MTPKGNRFITSLVALLAIMGAEAQSASEVPSLVVNVMIDQLRSDYLEAFSPLYGQGGFVRLMDKGRMYTQAEYPFDGPDAASSVACFITGTSPYENGIIGQRWLDRQTLQPVFCVDDNKYGGLYTLDKSSPQYLAVSTIGDELKVASEGKSVVLSIAPNRDAAILSAGHAADGAIWIDDWTGRISGTSYYGTLPDWATGFENSNPLSSRIGDIVWKPLNDEVVNFSYFVFEGSKKPFGHKFTGDRKFRQFKASSCVNDEVNLLVKELLSKTSIGTDGVPDMLNLTYYAGGFDHESDSKYAMEVQDTYARLDRQLEELINAVESKVGQNKALFVVTSTGYSDSEDAKDLSLYRIPTGTFSITKAKLLLNMYLIAVYGQGDYVETVMGNELYLNLKLIESKSLNLTEVLERSSDFLIQLSGVKDVYTSQRLALGAGTPGISKLRNAYNPKCSGDITIQVSPGWNLKNEDTLEQSFARESYMGFPLFLFGCGVAPGKVNIPVSIDRVAPTVSKALRIRAPNGCSQAPLNY